MATVVSRIWNGHAARSLIRELYADSQQRIERSSTGTQELIRAMQTERQQRLDTMQAATSEHLHGLARILERMDAHWQEAFEYRDRPAAERQGESLRAIQALQVYGAMMALTPCIYCEGLGEACVCIMATCGHRLSPEMDDAPPCEICDRCQSCCSCPDNDFRAGLRGE